MEQFSITVPMSTSGLRILRAAADQFSLALGASAASATAPAPAAAAKAPAAAAPAEAAAAPAEPKKRGRPPKAAAAPAPAQDDDLDLGGEDEESDAAGEDEGDELGLDEPAAPPAQKLTLSGHVIPAFRQALDRVKGDKSKLAKVLEAYGVKSVQHLPEAKFAEVIGKLAKLK